MFWVIHDIQLCMHSLPVISPDSANCFTIISLVLLHKYIPRGVPTQWCPKFIVYFHILVLHRTPFLRIATQWADHVWSDRLLSHLHQLTIMHLWLLNLHSGEPGDLNQLVFLLGFVFSNSCVYKDCRLSLFADSSQEHLHKLAILYVMCQKCSYW